MDWMNELINNSVVMLQIALFLVFFVVSIIVGVFMVLDSIVVWAKDLWYSIVQCFTKELEDDRVD